MVTYGTFSRTNLELKYIVVSQGWTVAQYYSPNSENAHLLTQICGSDNFNFSHFVASYQDGTTSMNQ